MNATERRMNMMRALRNTEQPVTGTQLAQQFGISRQVVVQDIALLRAAGNKILATPEGYIVPQIPLMRKVRRTFSCYHLPEQSLDELSIMVSGGTVLDVAVEHAIYGDFRVMLLLSSQAAVQDYVSRMSSAEAPPLEALSGGIHSHTVEADSIEAMDRIEANLRAHGFLVEEELAL